MNHEKVDFNNSTILVTGGAGFIGSNIVFHFQKKFPNSKIVVFDCFRNEEILSNGNPKSFGHYKNLNGFHGDVICGNLNNLADIDKLNDYSFDYIFHQAAISDTRAYDQELVIRTNVNSFYSILKLAKINKSVLIYASSAATYGSAKSPQSLGNENPDNPYGYSKFTMDKIAQNFAKNNEGIIICGLRYFNVYGNREFYKGKTASMIIQLGHQILSGKSPRLFEGSEKILRDFIFIDDVIQANIKACERRISGIFNVGTGIARSFQDIADILQNNLDTKLKTEYFPNPHTGYQTHTEADISHTKKNLGFKPKYTLESGIKKYIPEIRNHYSENFE